jgi:gas vesicle protein
MAESNIGQDIQAEVLNAIRKSQAAIVDTIERWASTVQAVKPDMPDLPFADSLNFADKLPKPQDLQDEFLNTVRKSQEAVIDAIKSWVETVQSITPKVPSVQVPFADKLPKPEEVVANAYDFAEKLLAGQRKFAEDVLKATAALQPGDDAKKTGSAK